MYKTKIKIQSENKNNNGYSNWCYDTFTFLDNVTKSKILLCDMKNSRKTYNPKIVKKNRQIRQSRSSLNLKTCLEMLESTKIFQKQALRNKIFKQVQEEIINTQTGNQIEKINNKKQLRKLMIDQIDAINKKQFRRYISENNTHPNPSIITLSKSIPTVINKKSIQNIVKIGQGIQLQQEEDKQQVNIFKKNKICKEKIVLQGQQQFVQRINDHIQAKFKENAEYLIRPKSYFIKRYNSKTAQPKSKNVNSQFSEQLTQTISNLNFKPLQTSQKVKQLSQKLQHKSLNFNENQLLIFCLIKNGCSFDLNLQLISRPQYLNLIDDKGNNLLHVAVKSSQFEIFQELIKGHKGAQLLVKKNQFKRTPIDLASILGLKNFVKIGQDALKIFDIRKQ